MTKSEVYLVSADDRGEGSRRCLKYFPLPDYSGKTVLVKPNFNSADPPPGSTHNDTLDVLLGAVKEANAQRIILGERSGPAEVEEVFRQKGIGALCEKHGAEFVPFSALSDEDWVVIEQPGLHWQGGLKVARAVTEAGAVVATCCLKTHGFGGVFSSALKLAVGITPKNFNLLHNTKDQRKMIAEINLAYAPDLVIVDAVEVFTDGGPMEGVRNRANLMLAGSDRVALDAVGLAILKYLGSNAAIMDTPIFKQEQIARAVELGLGAASPEEIQIVTDDERSGVVVEKIKAILNNG